MGFGEPGLIFFSSLLRHAVYPAMSGARLFSRRLVAGQVCVLTYHGVLPEGLARDRSPISASLVSTEQFRSQLRFLKSHYTLVTPEEFHAWLNGTTEMPRRAVLITCDDGFLNALTDMVPILLEEEAQCLFFVTGASLGSSPGCLWYEELYRMLDDAPQSAKFEVEGNAIRKSAIARKDGLHAYWWRLVQQLSRLPGKDRTAALAALRVEWQLPADWKIYDSRDARIERRFRLINLNELTELVACGMTVGAHTLSHLWLANIPTGLVEQEIRESRRQLELHLKREIWALAYPFGTRGSVNMREMKIAEEAGYTCAFMNQGGGLQRHESPRFALPRAHVASAMSLAELEAHLSGFHEGLQRCFYRDGTSQEAKPCA